jgi:chromosome segregation ATPase
MVLGEFLNLSCCFDKQVDRKRYIPCSEFATTGTDEVESGHNVTTSQELLKLFSQIRMLEERHNQALHLTTALHEELMQAHSRVRELELPDRMARREVERLQSTHEAEKLSWRVKEKEKIKAAVQSVKAELEEERKEKKRLESANRKVTKELMEAKSETSRALQELENERKTRQLMQEVCTELAQETGNDKAEAEEMKRQTQREREELEEERRMLQLAEVWREERVQMKLGEARLALETKSAALDVMRAELESFLASKPNGDTYDNTTFRDAQVLHDVVSAVRYDTTISTFPPTSSMSSMSSNSSFAPTSEYMYGATIDTDSSQESRDHGHSLLYYPEGIPDAD